MGGCTTNSYKPCFLLCPKICETFLPPTQQNHNSKKPGFAVPSLVSNMSDGGEIEVEATSGFKVLPKDVVEEVGTIKLL